MKVLSYVVTYLVYNPLGRFARRIVDYMKSREAKFNLAIMLLPLGFSFIVAALAFNLREIAKWLLLIAGAMAIIGGQLVASRIIKKMEIEENNERAERDKEREEQKRERNADKNERQRIIAVLEAIATKMGVDVDKISRVPNERDKDE